MEGKIVFLEDFLKSENFKTGLLKKKYNTDKDSIVLSTTQAHDGLLLYTLQAIDAVTIAAVEEIEVNPTLAVCFCKIVVNQEPDGCVDLPCGRYRGHHETVVMVLQ
jgi:hypothetical protein